MLRMCHFPGFEMKTIFIVLYVQKPPLYRLNFLYGRTKA